MSQASLANVWSRRRSLSAALKEYEIVTAFCQHLHQVYTRTLFYILIAAGAVATLLTQTNQSAEVIGLLSIPLTLLLDAWLPGWAYANLEVWSYREYLASLERFIRKELGISEGQSPFHLHDSGLLGMYRLRAFSKRIPLHCHGLLNLCFVLGVAPIYLATFLAGLCFGFPALIEYTPLGPWEFLFHAVVASTFCLISVVCVVSTVWVYFRVGAERRSRLEL